MASAFDDIGLKPLQAEDAVDPDVTIPMTITFEVTTDGINRGMFNSLPYLAPKVPSLNTLLSQGNYSLSAEVYGPQTMAFVLNHLDMVELVLNNRDKNSHPCKRVKSVCWLVGAGKV